jgi:tetratricopeptide (TPR) repeat protein
MTENPRLEELKRRVQRDPASISFAALAEEYRRLGMFAEAIEACHAGLQRHPSYISARVTLGRALIEVGEFDEASSELEEVLRSAPENLAAIRALADIHRRRGEVSDADHYQATVPSAEASFEERPPAVVEPPSAPARIAVQSAPMVVDPEPPALVELEALLAAIERARRDVTFQAVR